MIAMGGGDLFNLTDGNSLHRNVNFPGQDHASFYNVATMEPVVKRYLLKKGATIATATRVTDAYKAVKRFVLRGMCSLKHRYGGAAGQL